MKKDYKTVLIVDRDEVVQTMGSAILKKSGAEVHTASNLQEAQELVTNEVYHCMLVDVNFSDITHDFNGLMNNTEEATKIIGLLGRNQHNIHRRQEISMMAEFLEKPLDIERLSAAVGF